MMSISPPIRVGFVRYLNTLPLVAGLENMQGIELVPAVPSKLASMLRSKQVDLALTSVIDAVGADDLTLIDAGGIGCDGPTLTVRIYSALPMSQVTTLHADTDSHTSVVLAQIILAKKFGRCVKIVDYHARERVAINASHVAPPPSQHSDELEDFWPTTMLMIGDKVVTDSPPAVRYPYSLDLGEQWKELTGLPFVYATWMCRKDGQHEPNVARMARVLDRQRRRNTMRMDWLIAMAHEQRRWPKDLARKYVTEYLHYEVGPQQKQAISKFASEAHALGLVASQSLRWLNWQSSPELSEENETIG